MSTPEMSLDLESLDAPETELLNVEPTPEPAAAPEPKAEAAPRDPATGQFTPQAPASMPDPVKAVEPEPAKVVPLPVLLEERRNARREIDEAHRKTMELEQRLKALESPPAPEPSFTDDPKAYIDAKVTQVQEMVKPIEQKAEVGAQLVQLQQFMRHVGTIEAEFVKENPDYYQALDHVRSIRRAELAEFYPQATPEQIVQQIDREEILPYEDEYRQSWAAKKLPSAADIIRRAMIRMDDALNKAGLSARMLLQVHDELVLEVAPGEVDAVTELVRREMAGAYELLVPLEVSVGTGRTWAEAGH